MDLSALGSSLPPGLAETEREMGDKFRASALSITTLYKSALAATKQAYTVGYTSCLSDVLEIVQNSLSENPENGQDAGQALSRLMDWADARKAALQAFESDEEREDATSAARANAPTTRLPRPASAQAVGISNKGASHGPRSSLPSHLAHSAPARPSSAPLTPIAHDQMGQRGRSAEPTYANQPVAGPSRSPEGLQTPAPLQRNSRYQPTPAQMPSSSPTSASTSNLFQSNSSHTSPSFLSHQNRTTKHLPRHSLGSVPSTDGHHPPSSATFAPAIGLDEAPFVSFPTVHQDPSILETNFNVGNKRPISAVFPGGDEMTGVVEETMPPLIRSSSASGRGGRRKGRAAVEDTGGDERERKRSSRRAGGAGGGGNSGGGL